ncbi:ABC-2 transporter permease [Clostridium sp. JN-1]|jgi:hypothetical protein|uniref:ABC-2 transporter permease n=1 Tax=Clostridium sp. JN-1 TaxID=2483110 RepID=UPI000F0B43DA|nr:ABC-2 transporter permease [Clostridium sp. JN-1]
MINLINKELILVRKSLYIFTLILAVCVYIVYKASKFNNLGYGFIVLFMGYLSFLIMERYKKRKNDYMIINSLPVHRNLVVLSNYLMMIIYTLFFYLVMAVETLLLKVIGIKGYNLTSPWVLIVPLSCLLIYFAIINPFEIKESKFIESVKLVTYILLFLIPQIIKKISETVIGGKIIGFLTRPDLIYTIMTAFFIVGLVSYTISYLVSLKLYRNFDF